MKDSHADRIAVGERVEVVVSPRTGWLGEVIETSGLHSVRVRLDDPVADLGGARDFWYFDVEVRRPA